MKTIITKPALFTKSGCLSADGFAYMFEGKQSENDMVKIREHLSACELCREAVEGAESYSSFGDFKRNLDSLDKRWKLRKPGPDRTMKVILRVAIPAAASVVLFFSLKALLSFPSAGNDHHTARVIEKGKPIEVALNSQKSQFAPSEFSKKAGNDALIAVEDQKVREEFKKLVTTRTEEKIPIALLEKAIVVAEKNISDVPTETKNDVPGAGQSTPAQLNYPFRVMSMPPPELPEEVFLLVDAMPRFRDKGMQQFSRYIRQRLIYPEEAMQKHIGGKVYVQFTINERGTVSDVKILKSSHPLLDAEVVRVIKNSPEWTPGKQNGRPVKVAMVMPVEFVND